MTADHNDSPAAHPPARARRQHDNSALEKLIAGIVFSSRWLQAPLYLGLIAAQGVYVVLFFRTLGHLIAEISNIQDSDIMLVVLELIDMVMISNLLVMVIIGGYEIFVSRLNMNSHPDKPEWLSHMNANTMKIKLAMALIGISSIHLLKTFIAIDDISSFSVMWQCILHGMFLVSALAVAGTAALSTRVLLMEAEQSRHHHVG